MSIPYFGRTITSACIMHADEHIYLILLRKYSVRRKAVERLKYGTIIIVVLFFEPEQFKLLQNVYNGY
jgi:hypothetical protein